MIEGLVVRLMAGAGEDAVHEGWCDTGPATKAQTCKGEAAAVEVLHDEIDELRGFDCKAHRPNCGPTKGVPCNAAMAKAAQQRVEEEAKDAETVEDAGEAQTAVARALVVLREFYAKAGSPAPAAVYAVLPASMYHPGG